jgi:hypothetical protein
MSDPWSTVAALGSAIRYGGSSLADVPVLVIKVVDGDLWRKFRSPAGDVEHHSFEEFVMKPKPGGLGTTISMLKDLCRSNTLALAAIEEATDRPAGNPTGRNQYSNTVGEQLGDEHWCIDGCDECEGGIGNNIPNSSRPEGTSVAKALRRLRKDRPDLHAQVLIGQVSAHAAAVQAGFRPKTFTVRADKAESIVATLRRQLDPEVLALVTKLLSEGE